MLHDVKKKAKRSPRPNTPVFSAAAPVFVYSPTAPKLLTPITPTSAEPPSRMTPTTSSRTLWAAPAELPSDLDTPTPTKPLISSLYSLTISPIPVSFTNTLYNLTMSL